MIIFPFKTLMFAYPHPPRFELHFSNYLQDIKLFQNQQVQNRFKSSHFDTSLSSFFQAKNCSSHLIFPTLNVSSSLLPKSSLKYVTILPSRLPLYSSPQITILIMNQVSCHYSTPCPKTTLIISPGHSKIKGLSLLS